MPSGAAGVSWAQPDSHHERELIARTGIPDQAPIIDIGGASGLACDLIEAGYRDVTVLDAFATALALARDRLRDQADSVHWITTDLLDWQPECRYAIWHDRATFHFMTTEPARERYRAALSAALAAGGHVIVGSFAPDGPDRCSDRPVCPL